MCGFFVIFVDDNLYLVVNCEKWGNNRNGSECNRWGFYRNKGIFWVYNDLIFWEGKYCINLKILILVCDDLFNKLVFLLCGDKW